MNHRFLDWYGIYYTYDDTGKIVSFNYDNDVSTNGDGDEYFYIRNYQGDIIAIIDSAGNIEVEYTYDAWGNIVSVSDTSGTNLAQINPIRYRGYYFDEQMGWYYLQSRYYNPESCRFINNDVIIGEFASGNSNIFSYTTNNPVNYADSTGYVRYKNIGVGVQIAFSVSISWVSFSGGFELVWYTSQQVELGKTSRYVPHVYWFVEAGLEFLFSGMGIVDKLIEDLTKTASNPKFIQQELVYQALR